MSTISIQELAKLCEDGKTFIEVKYIKDVKGVAQQRFFITFRGHRGSIQITCGNCTRVNDDPPYEKPFLGRVPAAHPDSSPDCTTLGALTIIPDKSEGDAWIYVNRWIKKAILQLGAIKNNKGKVVTTLEELELVCKDMIVEPVEGDDKRTNVCFWQKFQKSDKPGLSTTFSYINCEPDATGKMVPYECGEFDPSLLKAGTPFYTVISVGELKKAPTGWGICLYTRKVFIDLHSEHEGSGGDPVVVFGGVRVVPHATGGAGAGTGGAGAGGAGAGGAGAGTGAGAGVGAGTGNSTVPVFEAAGTFLTEKVLPAPSSPVPTLTPTLVPDIQPSGELTAAGDECLGEAVRGIASTAAESASVGDKRAAPAGELVPGIESDVSGLAAAIAKIRDPEQKRAKRA